MVLVTLPEFTALSDCLRPAVIMLLVLLFEFIIFVARGLVDVGCIASYLVGIIVFVFADGR
jgi:hypothetical protein